jgi:hypothetical protein
MLYLTKAEDNCLRQRPKTRTAYYNEAVALRLLFLHNSTFLSLHNPMECIPFNATRFYVKCCNQRISLFEHNL